MTSSIKHGEQREYLDNGSYINSYYNGLLDKTYQFDANGRLLEMTSYQAGRNTVRPVIRPRAVMLSPFMLTMSIIAPQAHVTASMLTAN